MMKIMMASNKAKAFHTMRYSILETPKQTMNVPTETLNLERQRTWQKFCTVVGSRTTERVNHDSHCRTPVSEST
jgi:hypothetical protein